MAGGGRIPGGNKSHKHSYMTVSNPQPAGLQHGTLTNAHRTALTSHRKEHTCHDCEWKQPEVSNNQIFMFEKHKYHIF